MVVRINTQCTDQNAKELKEQLLAIKDEEYNDSRLSNGPISAVTEKIADAGNKILTEDRTTEAITGLAGSQHGGSGRGSGRRGTKRALQVEAKD